MTLSPRLRTLAYCWIVLASAGWLVDLLRQTRDHLTNGALRPFGDDFINYWSAAWLALHGRAETIYDWNAFHAFEAGIAGASIDFFHYSYPPSMLVLSAPLGLIPYVPALFVWLIAGWLAFYAALRLADPERQVLVLALATPAVFINAVGGQNGTWTAALFGGGLVLLERRPILAGILFGLLTYKPQMGVLLPLALLAGRQWRAIIAAAATAAILVTASVLLFGTKIWPVYAAHVEVLRHVILEDGTGVWYRMLSVFVAARRLGADVPTAYAVQAVAGLVSAPVVALAWWRDAPVPARNVLLVLGTCLTTPYLQDYDLVVGAFVALWLMQLYPASSMPPVAMTAAALILLIPFVGAALGHLTGLDVGPLFIAPAFVIAAQAARVGMRSRRAPLKADVA
jgi:arabinofuranan 3-O-arabinosyltransferase